MIDWLQGLTRKDWLLDGRPIRGEYLIDKFNHLDWSKAWVDLGPSVAGNLGPYWHVPMDDGDTTHRLYPKVLAGKWLLLIRQACEEHAAKRGKSLSDYSNAEIATEHYWRAQQALGDPHVVVGMNADVGAPTGGDK